VKLIQVHRDSPKLAKLLEIFLREVERVHTLADDVRTKRALNGGGAQLDQLGRLVLLSRGDLGDSAYRLALRCWIRALRSHGTARDLLDVLQLAIPDGTRYDLDEAPPMTTVIEVLDGLEAPPRVVLRARAAGTALFIVWAPGPVETSFRLAHATEGLGGGFGYADEEDTEIGAPFGSVVWG